MNVEIIPVTIDDADDLTAIQQQAFKRLYDIYRDEGSPYLRGVDEIALWLERPNWQVYKIIADGVLCGGVSFCERNGIPGEYYLARIYILPELQGKGIASTAILLCEATVANASRWTLDFPVNEIANRRCYEKAGYTDTGERREQSGGAITLAYMEKHILSMPKTLYISDLDGTLLNRNAELSEYTIDALNRLISNGVHFSVATARTAATSLLMLERIPINVPIILMNGVLIYDIQTHRYVKKELLGETKVEQVIATMKTTGLTGLMYALSDDELITYYERLDNDALKAFVDERMRKYNKQFSQIDDFANADTEIIYFCFLDTNDNIHRLHKEIAEIDGLRVEMYQDIYSDDLWYLEIFNDTASKYNAVQFLQREYGFNKVVGFGDNLNDLPLFAACDECYAVANAKPEVKEKATAVIGKNDDDGVAKWLEERILL